MLSAVRWFVRRRLPEYGTAPDKFLFILMSLYLLSRESWETLAVFLWVVIAGVVGLGAINRAAKERTKWFFFWATVLVQLAPLFYYKYSNFFGGLVGWEFSGNSGNFLIPMGISFYTFQMLSLVVDTRIRGERSPSFSDTLHFASFFPQIVAGPIERKESLLPQVRSATFTIKRDQIELGLSWIILGFFFKLALAGNMSLIDETLRRPFGNFLAVGIESFVFGLRIYYDFAGYSFIALGLAFMFGVRLTQNFESPYLARNIQLFWRRWHITLSNWFRDYVYIPLGGARSSRWHFNILIVFLVSGIWHGAGVGFVIWGALHGLAVLICHSFKGLRIPAVLSWLLTFFFTAFAWMFFKEPVLAACMKKLALFGQLSPASFSPSAFLNLFASPGDAVAMIGILLLSLIVFIIEFVSLRRGSAYSCFRDFRVQLVMIALTVILAPLDEGGFIYFNF